MEFRHNCEHTPSVQEIIKMALKVTTVKLERESTGFRTLKWIPQDNVGDMEILHYRNHSQPDSLKRQEREVSQAGSSGTGDGYDRGGSDRKRRQPVWDASEYARS